MTMFDSRQNSAVFNDHSKNTRLLNGPDLLPVPEEVPVLAKLDWEATNKARFKGLPLPLYYLFGAPHPKVVAIAESTYNLLQLPHQKHHHNPY